MKTERRMLFLNLGWMIHYSGPDEDDPTIGAFGYLTDRTHGHECYNFQDQSGFLLGNHPSGSGTNLQQLGAPNGSDSIDNIDVVWFSKHPHTNRAVIIGWYLKATVFKSFQTPQHDGALLFEGELIGYKVKALTTDCTLLPVADRLSRGTKIQEFGLSDGITALKRQNCERAVHSETGLRQLIRNGFKPLLY